MVEFDKNDLRTRKRFLYDMGPLTLVRGPIFASFFRDAFPQTGFSLHSPRVKFLSEGGVLAFLGDYMVIS